MWVCNVSGYVLHTMLFVRYAESVCVKGSEIEREISLLTDPGVFTILLKLFVVRSIMCRVSLLIPIWSFLPSDAK